MPGIVPGSGVTVVREACTLSSRNSGWGASSGGKVAGSVFPAALAEPTGSGLPRSPTPKRIPDGQPPALLSIPARCQPSAGPSDRRLPDGRHLPPTVCAASPGGSEWRGRLGSSHTGT